MSIDFGELSLAIACGALSSAWLVVGAFAGLSGRLTHRSVALVMSVGAGLLLAAASLELGAEAMRRLGPSQTVTALLLGAAMFSGANALLASHGAANRKRCGECTPQPSESEQPGSGMAIALGTALDAVPEALALGLALSERAVLLPLLIAISVGNLTESLSGAAGMRLAGRTPRAVLLLWSAIATGAAVLTAVGFVALGALPEAWPPRLQAFGAGALLAMTAESMLPEAFHNSPRFSGFLAAIGFCVLLLVGSASPEGR